MVTYVDLVQRYSKSLCKTLFGLSVWLVLLLVVRLENIVLLLCQTWFYIDGETGQVVCEGSVL